LKKLLNKRILIISLIVLAAMLVISGVAYAVVYELNKTIPSTAEVTAPPPPPPKPTQATLYKDLECTQEIDWTVADPLDFGQIGVGDTVTKFVYFKANKSSSVPGGYGFGEIDPGSIAVTNDIDTGVATFAFIVDEPSGSLVNGNHPCMITFSVTGVGAGTSDFDIVVTGDDGT
jgi:hypothetical protein